MTGRGVHEDGRPGASSMRLVPAAIAASLLFLTTAAPGLRADPPPAPVPVAPVPGAAQPVPAILVSARIVKATPRAARSLRLLGAARTMDEVPTYDPAALERRLCCWQRAGHVETVSAPRIAALPGQKATV